MIRESESRRAETPHGRAAVLRLASWFEQADTATAHRLYTAAFALYPARHLGGSTEDAVAAAASWWDTPAADTSTARPGGHGSLAAVEDHSAQQARLRDTAEAAAHWRRSAAEEVRSLLAAPTPRTGRLAMAEAALGVLMELLTRALGSGDATAGPVSAGDLELDIRLHVRHDPGAVLVIGEDGGDLTLNGLRLRATSYAQVDLDRSETEDRDGAEETEDRDGSEDRDDRDGAEETDTETDGTPDTTAPQA
ncbi:DUF2397 family protein [Thermobifida halotolerans]|uniref:DUF2397 family protein n=1 Tax=Thermobifida halotolerans TaxID=483545 RepID=A0AA97M2R2_9ACTN|nr:DUF2397 family protein [Thermobifida halotolerans]UOE18389.1 DUF2397 family protein [Thermobifida halotolerans]